MKWYEYEDLINSKLINYWKSLLQRVNQRISTMVAATVNSSITTTAISKIHNIKNVPAEFQKKVHHMQDIYKVFNGKQFVLKICENIYTRAKLLATIIREKFNQSDKLLAGLFFIFIISTLMFFKSSFVILSKTFLSEKPTRNIASEDKNKQKLNSRPVYYNASKKQFTVHNMSIPILVGKKLKVRSINLDATLTCSNRYTKILLDTRHHLIHNQMTKTMAPIVSSFPITEEGKLILRSKIKKEINQLLRELNIKGSVEEVKIIHILSS